MIPQSFIQDLLARVDIVDVIERHLPLKKGGANYFACCPFHGEKTPSFSVSPSKQFYYCFGCGANGSAIGFLMEYSGLNFVEAVKTLARDVGMEVPDDDRPGTPRTPPPDNGLFDTVAAAATFYREQLRQAPAAIDYLKRRGLTGEVAARFGIGYAPDDWQALEKVFDDYRDEKLLEVGLVVENDKGRRYDRFRNRIIFPIQDRRGRVIAFGGRVLDNGEPKYLNSPETPLFEKGRELYGIVQAQKPIREKAHALVVEGYMDVVALAQFGVDNAVATLGTATTPHHIKTLLRHTDRIIFCFDGDKAGRRAAWRALESALEELRDGATVAFLFLPEEHDPDSFVRTEGTQALRKAADEATPLIRFLLDEISAQCQLNSAEGRAKLVHETAPLVRRLNAPLLRLQLIKELAEASALTQDEIEHILGLQPPPSDARKAAPAETASTPRRQPRMARNKTRHRPVSPAGALLRLCLQHPLLVPRIPVDILPDDSDEALALTALCDAASTGDLELDIDAGALVEFFRDTSHHATLSASAAEMHSTHYDEDIVETLFEDTLCKLVSHSIDREIAALTELSRERGLTVGEQKRLAELLIDKRKASSPSKIDHL